LCFEAFGALLRKAKDENRLDEKEFMRIKSRQQHESPEAFHTALEALKG
jgi:hypothetical protein